jgi:hypothetical protein
MLPALTPRRRATLARIARTAATATFASAVVLAAAPGTSAAAPHARRRGGAAVKACIAAHEEALSLRADKKPHAAREKFVECARSECPHALRKECGDQLTIAEKDAPTVALEARDDQGNDTTDVRVTMDGAEVASRLTGAAIDVEPGEHVFRFERADGKTVERKVLVVEGEKNRKVVGDFSTLLPKPAPEEPQPGRAAKPAVSPLVFVAGGVALLGAASFAYFAATGKGSEHDLAGSCSPRCTDDEVAPVKRDYLAADLSLGVAVVAAAVAVVLALPALRRGATGSAQSASAARAAPWMPRVRVIGSRAGAR